MMKNILKYMTIALMAFTCVGFTACGGDDDDNLDGGSSSSNVLVGTWTKHIGSWPDTFIFYSDGTGVYKNGNNNGTYQTGIVYSIKSYSGNKGTVYIKYNDDGYSETRGFTINGNRLRFENELEDYIKQ